MSRVIWLLCVPLCWGEAVAGQEAYKPALPVRAASREGQVAMQKFALPDDLRVSLWAAEPALANPVAFCVDPRGRIYVAESFRLHQGVTDNRNHKNWIDDELACRTVEDRIAMYRRRFSHTIHEWETEQERIRLLEDTDGDGAADRAVVYADGFKDLADGIGAGLLARGDQVYYTCIPKLWLLEDKDGDGQAEARKALHHGYGVHTALLGHDLHGLRIGPDGKLYFSIGDRGCHIETPDGRVVSYPDEGAVFRCNLDGSELEVVHRGLRNPQELAFDKFGNLFTGDNNSDGGDLARWVYVVEGGNSGWQIGYQSMPDRGPWNTEKLWQPYHAGQAAYIVPPIANLADGPSGLAFDPGTGLPARYRDCFLLCDFRGSSDISGIWALKCRPKGAAFELVSAQHFVWKVLATDVDFGVDGAVYLTDWTEGWRQTGKGRVYRVAAAVEKSPICAETRALLARGFEGLARERLVELLGHRDQRVRREAQFALAACGATEALTRTALSLERRMARIHAIWGLGQLSRERPEVLQPLMALLDDLDDEVRAQVARVAGWGRYRAGIEALERGLEDRSSRVRFFAAISLGQIGDGKSRQAVIEMLRANDDRDPYLRHAGVMALAGMGDVPALLVHATDRSAAVRMGVLLALRRLQRREIGNFLADADPLLVVEAARAINDVPIPAAMPDLARILSFQMRFPMPRAVLRRAIHANFRVATEECVERLVRFCSWSSAADDLRVEGLRALVEWQRPAMRDLVTNQWRPPLERDRKSVADKLKRQLPVLLRLAPDAVREEAARAAGVYRVKAATSALYDLVKDQSRSGPTRAAALVALEALDSAKLAEMARIAADDANRELRQAGFRVLAKLEPRTAVRLLETVAHSGPLRDRQNALEVLATVKTAAADEVLGKLFGELMAGKLPQTIELELLEAVAVREPLRERAARYAASRGTAPAAKYRQALRGGHQDRGNDIFYNNIRTTCVRCHTTSGKGGRPGPDLQDVGSRLTREQLLEALVDPGKRIADGFGTCVVEMKDGAVHSGVVKSASETHVRLELEDGNVLELSKPDVEFMSNPTSAMPPVAGLLTTREIRDLVEFLASLEKRGAGSAEAAPRKE